MGRILVVAEKPDQGRSIARCLNCRQQGKGGGFLIGEKHVVTWAYGHLITLSDAKDYDSKYKKWLIDDLPIIPRQMQIKVVPEKEKQFNVIKALMLDASIEEINFATDAGREGELIARWIYTMAGCTKPIKRLWISSLTDDAILKGFENLKPGSDYNNVYFSALCRAYADWFMGINLTRLYSIKYNATLNVGRVQTPTLALTVAKQKEIDSFKDKEYWEVQSIYDKGFTGHWVDKITGDTRLYDKAAATGIASKVKGRTGTVSNIDDTPEKENPPQLYSLSELQQDANRKYGYTAKETLDIAQKLYEQRKYITYPRTDSRVLTEDIKATLPSTIEKLKVEPYKKLVEYVLNLDRLPTSKRIIDDSKVSDHHAIIPTPVKPNIDSLSDEEESIYDLIVRRFLAAFHPCYEYTVRTVEVECENEIFVSRGKTIDCLGWMECYIENKEEDMQDQADGSKKNIKDQPLPRISIGDTVEFVDLRTHYIRTSPPSPYTDATLLSAMINAGRFVSNKELKEKLKETKGLGTEATRAAVIENLIDTGYLKRKTKYLVPTDKGVNLIEIVHDELKSPEMTGQWEKALSQVADGKMDRTIFMDCIIDFLNKLVDEIKNTEALNVEFEKTMPVFKRR